MTQQHAKSNATILAAFENPTAMVPSHRQTPCSRFSTTLFSRYAKALKSIRYISSKIPYWLTGFCSNNPRMRQLLPDMSDPLSTGRLHPTPTATWVFILTTLTMFRHARRFAMLKISASPLTSTLRGTRQWTRPMAAQTLLASPMSNALCGVLVSLRKRPSIPASIVGTFMLSSPVPMVCIHRNYPFAPFASI